MTSLPYVAFWLAVAAIVSAMLLGFAIECAAKAWQAVQQSRLEAAQAAKDEAMALSSAQAIDALATRVHELELKSGFGGRR